MVSIKLDVNVDLASRKVDAIELAKAIDIIV